jgi:hypothetical protein
MKIVKECLFDILLIVEMTTQTILHTKKLNIEKLKSSMVHEKCR